MIYGCGGNHEGKSDRPPIPRGALRALVVEVQEDGEGVEPLRIKGTSTRDRRPRAGRLPPLPRIDDAVVCEPSGNSIYADSAKFKPVWSKNAICMKSKDDGGRGPSSPDRGVTTRYITKKSPRNAGMAPRNQPDNISCFQRDRVFGPYGD